MNRAVLPEVTRAAEEITNCAKCPNFILRSVYRGDHYCEELYYYFACKGLPGWKDLTEESPHAPSIKAEYEILIPDWCPIRIKEEEEL